MLVQQFDGRYFEQQDPILPPLNTLKKIDLGKTRERLVRTFIF